MQASPPSDLPRKLGLVDSLSIVVGTMIGSGIFLVPFSIAQTVPSTEWILAVWVVAGLVSLCGALAFAELGAMAPAAGGQYAHLREAFGPFWAFLFGWGLFLVIRSGGTATLAVGFAIYLGQFVPLTPVTSKLASVAIIAVLTWVNYRGVRLGAGVQNVLTFAKVAGIVLLIGSAVFYDAPSKMSWTGPGVDMTISTFGVAMIACLWSYQGWFSVSWVAGEVRNPARDLPVALALGVAIVMAIYLSANLAYFKVLGLEGIAANERVAAAAAELTFGAGGGTIVALIILISISGAINSGILSAPRVYFAQARDGLFFRKFGEIHPVYETPAFSVAMQGAWAIVLAVSGTYERLFSYVIFTSWLFYGLTVAGVFVLRKRYPDHPRPYRMWGYPVTPALFCLIAFGFVINTIITRPGPAGLGLLLLASGVPAYYWWKRSRVIA